jgi:hypothetical protein
LPDKIHRDPSNSILEGGNSLFDFALVGRAQVEPHRKYDFGWLES